MAWAGDDSWGCSLDGEQGRLLCGGGARIRYGIRVWRDSHSRQYQSSIHCLLVPESTLHSSNYAA